MSETNVGANRVFARRTTIVCEPMSEAIVSNSFSNIGLIPVFVRRANIRFAPTLVLLIGLIPVFARRAVHKGRPTRRITKNLLRSTRKFMIAYLITSPNPTSQTWLTDLNIAYHQFLYHPIFFIFLFITNVHYVLHLSNNHCIEHK